MMLDYTLGLIFVDLIIIFLSDMMTVLLQMEFEGTG